MNYFSSMELMILHGPQSGAHVRFNDKAELSIGTDLSKDIVLRDPTVSDHHLKLLLSEQKVILQVVKGEILVMDRRLTSGEQTELTAYVPVKIGETVFAFGEVGDSQWEHMPVNNSVDEAVADSEEVTEISDYLLDHYPFLYRNFQKYQNFALPGLLLFIALSTVILLFQPQKVEVSVDEQINQLVEFLQQEEFIHLQHEKTADGQLTIQGYLTKKSDIVRLDNYISELNLVINKNIEVGEELAAQVNNVYRLNNVEADVLLLEQGTVRVSTAENDLDVLKKIEQIAYRDVPQLNKLEVENNPKDINTDDPDNVKNDPGKIVTMIVPGNPAHLVTSDRSRYFVGAMLPTGHKISGIAQDKVFLVKAGVETTLKF